MQLEDMQLIVYALKETHGVAEWQEDMMWVKHWQAPGKARVLIRMLEKEIKEKRIEKLKKELAVLEGEE